MSISLVGIEKSFGTNLVLDGVDISVDPGEFVTLVGASGCGKSTLLRILAGLESPDAGQVCVSGKDMTQVRPAERNLAMVFQSYALYPHLTVAENMVTPLRLRDLPWHAQVPLLGTFFHRKAIKELYRQVNNAAEVLKISHLLDRKPGQLSGGQRQRAALGRALVRKPVAFLMDEPLSNLDAALRVHMRAELSELHRRLGTTFIYVTHDQSEALTMSDRMAMMDRGRILQYGPPDEIYNNPLNIEVAKFIGSPPINILNGQIDEAGKLSLLGMPIGQANTAAHSIQFGCRPENVTLSETGVHAVVTHRENLGSEVFLHTTLHETNERVVLRAPAGTTEKVNDQVCLQLELEKLLAFNELGDRVHLIPDLHSPRLNGNPGLVRTKNNSDSPQVESR
ncbi:MAG: ABC transporter ATP-binding protein [Gammaproteobacteria bacterium]|nr:ABC transporter ATP-binding protein [Gammaproteobacteria bacterium]